MDLPISESKLKTKLHYLNQARQHLQSRNTLPYELEIYIGSLDVNKGCKLQGTEAVCSATIPQRCWGRKSSSSAQVKSMLHGTPLRGCSNKEKV